MWITRWLRDWKDKSALPAKANRCGLPTASIQWLPLIYQTAVYSLAVLILLTTLTAWMTHRVERVGQVTCHLSPSDTTSREEVHQHIRAALRELTADSKLMEFSRAADLTVDEADIPEAMARLRQGLTFAIQVDQHDATCVEVRLDARGQVDSSRFVETFCEALARQLDAPLKPGSPPAEAQSPPVEQSARLASMELERALLLAERLKGGLSGTPQPAATGDQGRSQPAHQDPALEGNGTFHTASFSRPSASRGSASASTEDLIVAAEQLQDALRSISALWPATAAESPQGGRTAISTIGMDPTAVKATDWKSTICPAGPLAGRSFLLLASLLSLGVGAFLAARLAVDGRRASAEEVEQSMGVPLLGEVHGLDPVARGPSGAHSHRILKLSEMFIFATFVLGFTLALLHAEFRSDLQANPIMAWCNVIWALRGV